MEEKEKREKERKKHFKNTKLEQNFVDKKVKACGFYSGVE